MILFVFAESENGIIGNKNQLPWYMPDDLKHFKEITLNKNVLAGRKTYLSIGKALPMRKNFVLSSHPQSMFNGMIVFNDIDEVLDFSDEHDIYIIGGASVFRQFVNFVDVIYRTVIHTDIDGDAKMPKINYDRFKLVDKQDYLADNKNEFDYSFLTYKRIK